MDEHKKQGEIVTVHREQIRLIRKTKDSSIINCTDAAKEGEKGALEQLEEAWHASRNPLEVAYERDRMASDEALRKVPKEDIRRAQDGLLQKAFEGQDLKTCTDEDVALFALSGIIIDRELGIWYREGEEPSRNE